MTERPQTLGEKRVRVDFNPSQEGVVYDIKRHTAALIDLVEKLKRDQGESGSGECARLCALAQTHYEDAAMWAVKAATTGR